MLTALSGVKLATPSPDSSAGRNRRTLLFSDAWSDVLASGGNHDSLFTLASAFLIELSLSGVALLDRYPGCPHTDGSGALLIGEGDRDPWGGVTSMRWPLAISPRFARYPRGWEEDSTFVEELKHVSPTPNM